MKIFKNNLKKCQQKLSEIKNNLEAAQYLSNGCSRKMPASFLHFIEHSFLKHLCLDQFSVIQGKVYMQRFSNTSFGRTLLGSNFGGLLLKQTFCRHFAAFPIGNAPALANPPAPYSIQKISKQDPKGYPQFRAFYTVVSRRHFHKSL